MSRPPRKTTKAFTKKLSRKTGKFYYLNSRGRRVSSVRYTQYLKRRKSALKSIPQKKHRSSKGKSQPKITSSKHEGKYTSGRNFEVKTNFLVSTTPSGEVIARLETLYQRIKSKVKHAMYFKIFFVALWANGEKEKGDLTTRISFKSEYANDGFRSRQITPMVQELYDLYEQAQVDDMPDFSLLNETPDRFKEAEDIRVYKLAVNQRNKSK